MALNSVLRQASAPLLPLKRQLVCRQFSKPSNGSADEIYQAISKGRQGTEAQTIVKIHHFQDGSPGRAPPIDDHDDELIDPFQANSFKTAPTLSTRFWELRAFNPTCSLSSRAKANESDSSIETSLLAALIPAPTGAISTVLDEWVREGKLDKNFLSKTSNRMRRNLPPYKALEYFVWLESSVLYEFKEKDYTTLLEIYGNLDRKKIVHVLKLMKQKNIIPTLPTYSALINIMGECQDPTGMENVMEVMWGEGIVLDFKTIIMIAEHYISLGLKDKCKGILGKIDGELSNNRRWAFKNLIILYGKLGEDEEVRKLWKLCEAKIRFEDCIAAIDAWGELGKIDEAESVIMKMGEIDEAFLSLEKILEVYKKYNMLSKGEYLIERYLRSKA